LTRVTVPLFQTADALAAAGLALSALKDHTARSSL